MSGSVVLEGLMSFRPTMKTISEHCITLIVQYPIGTQGSLSRGDDRRLENDVNRSARCF